MHTAYTPPQFDMPFYLVDEGGGIVDGEMETILTICVLGGQYHERREFAVFTASGPEDRCFGQPCPPATGRSYKQMIVQSYHFQVFFLIVVSYVLRYMHIHVYYTVHFDCSWNGLC